MQMNRQQSGQDGHQYNMENSSDLELYEVNFKANKLSKKQSSHSPQNNEHHDNNDEVIDEYINIYKEPIKSEEDDEDDDEEAQHHNRRHHHQQQEEEDDDELDEVNGSNSKYQRSSQRYATQEYSEQSPQNNVEFQYQNNIADIVRDQIQQHTDELEHMQQGIQNQRSVQMQNGQYNYINEMQEYQIQQGAIQQQHQRTLSQKQQSRNQEYDEHNEEPVRFEKQLSKMTPEEAEIEYQNRYQMQMQQLQQKQMSLKKSSENTQSATQSQQSSSRQTYMIQSDINSKQKRPSSGTIPKKQGGSQYSQQNTATQPKRSSNQQIRDGNSLEQLQTVKSSLMISSQETLSNNLQQTQANMQRLSQISETHSQQSNQYSKNRNTQSKQQVYTQPKPTQKRPQSSQPRNQEVQAEKLSNLYYHGMQIKIEKEQQLKMMKKENEERDLQKCTFRPELTQKAQALSLNNNNYLPIEDKTQIFMKRKQILIEKRIEEKKKQEVQGCTFTPKLNPKKYKPLPSDEDNMNVYDRQIEWQKKVQDKNTERMKNSYISMMTPSKRQDSQTRNSSAQKKSNFNSENNPNHSITNSTKRLKQVNVDKGFFSEKRFSGAFLTYLNCKYDHHKSGLDSSKNQEVPQVLTAKPQEKDQIQRELTYNENQHHSENDNIRIQKALDVCQTLGNNQYSENNQSNSKSQHPHEYTFGHLNQLPSSAYQQNHQQQQQQQQSSVTQPKVYQSNHQHSKHIPDSYSINKSAQNLKFKKAPPSSIDLIKQMVNKSLQDQFQSSKSISKSSSSAQIAKQYSYLNTLPKKVNFSTVSKLQNVVVQNNQYTLHDPDSQQDIQEFYSVKQQLGNNYYQQFQEKSLQQQLKTIPHQQQQEAQFFSNRKQGNTNNHHALFEQAYKINKEIKDLHVSGRKENVIQQQLHQEYGLQ